MGCRVGRFFGIFGREFVLERGYFWGAPLGEGFFLWFFQRGEEGEILIWAEEVF